MGRAPVTLAHTMRARGRPAAAVRAAAAGAAMVAVVAAFALPGAVAGQSTIRSEVDTTLVTVGDRITLTVRVEHPRDATVEWPDSVDLSPFEVTQFRVLPGETVGEEVVSAAQWLVAAFELGMLELPAFEVGVTGPGGEARFLETDRFGIEVVSVGADDTGDIRGIRGPLSIPIGIGTIAAWLLGLLLVVAASVWGYRRWAGRSEGAEPVEVGPPPRPAHDVALEALDRLAASDLLDRGEVKAWHIELSDIVRRYVEGRFGVAALEMTTWEVLDGLARAGVDAPVRDDLQRFLDPCDLVKFAKARPDAARSRAVLELGRDFVRSSAPEVRD